MTDIITLLAPCCAPKSGATKPASFSTSVIMHALTALFLGTLAGVALASAAYFFFQTSIMWTSLAGGGSALGGSLIFYVALRCLCGSGRVSKNSPQPISKKTPSPTIQETVPIKDVTHNVDRVLLKRILLARWTSVPQSTIIFLDELSMTDTPSNLESLASCVVTKAADNNKYTIYPNLVPHNQMVCQQVEIVARYMVMTDRAVAYTEARSESCTVYLGELSDEDAKGKNGFSVQTKQDLLRIDKEMAALYALQPSDLSSDGQDIARVILDSVIQAQYGVKFDRQPRKLPLSLHENALPLKNKNQAFQILDNLLKRGFINAWNHGNSVRSHIPIYILLDGTEDCKNDVEGKYVLPQWRDLFMVDTPLT